MVYAWHERREQRAKLHKINIKIEKHRNTNPNTKKIKYIQTKKKYKKVLFGISTIKPGVMTDIYMQKLKASPAAKWFQQKQKKVKQQELRVLERQRKKIQGQLMNVEKKEARNQLKVKKNLQKKRMLALNNRRWKT